MLDCLRNITVFLLLCCTPSVVAQHSSTASWMSALDSASPVCGLSIPGAHDAATGEGLVAPAGFGKTQSLTIAELWDSGVRAFDLRPALSGDGLHIYHGPLKTKLSFDEALSIICHKLELHPGEFAVVLMRNEGGGDRSLWAQRVGASIEALGNRAASFSPSMSVGDARGRILFLSRDGYEGCSKGARVEGWNHSARGTVAARIVSYSSGEAAILQVQDYYDTTDESRRQAKREAVLEYLDAAGCASANVWTINFLSAYSRTWLGFTPFATTAGYKRNARSVNALVAESLAARQQRKPSGILFMDFAGVDTVPGGVWHWSSFDVKGKALVEAIIEQNF